ncbi:alpha/beta hydrolase [Schaalia sp. 19OD2882]|uniref:alpha/beta fold hydrolase n=1 Tax=Schaalia sp. 19OD2882 TaxID=2794089 RepID=UPI001C1EAD7F|nr:alpha/beta hydrolase [Schaalia sp. 19OD2882]QWW19852.1 alpha/beta hydrolase [Schaalia sp. 19OD2882]
MSEVPPCPADEVDVLAPWGPQGPPPVDVWRTDILGPGFESRTLPLEPDDEGECVATLVRHRPTWEPEAQAPEPFRFVALYVHGRNDYFFQVELAESVARSGGAFYAIDLRKYGRSLRPGQTIGYVDDMATYDEDLSEALEVIRDEVGSLPLVLIGHSTGGLLVTLWAHRHPGAVAGLVLDSAWLEMHTMASIRPAAQQVLQRVAASNPKWEVPSGEGPDHYSRSLRGGWSESGLAPPERLRCADPADPGISGWHYATEWKRPGSYPVFAGWLEAVMAGHDLVDKSVHVECPVLSMMSTSTYFGEQWGPEVFTSDVVLDVTVNAERSARLSDQVTIARFPGRHDLFLSDPDVRQHVWDTMERWLRAFV